jgi:SWI/SNF-related matrix-associated actin-dependent regulator of chromatin subfamily B member 1
MQSPHGSNGSNPRNDDTTSPAATQDAESDLKERKDKARAVLQASGAMGDTTDDVTTATVDSRKSTPTTNGRKRSRSGSPPQAQSATSSSTASKETAKESTTDLVVRSTTKQRQLDDFVQRELVHTGALKDQEDAGMGLIRSKRADIQHYKESRRQNPGALFGYGYAGFGNGHTEGKPRIIYPRDRRKPGHKRTKELRISREKMATQAEQLEELVPIRLELDFEGYKIKLRDTFTWNLHDRVIPPELFAEQLVEDFKLPPQISQQLSTAVAHSLQSQIQDFYPQVFYHEESLDPHLPYYAYKNDEMRVLIKLNITIGQYTLVDQFEWEINNRDNSPEKFAMQMTCDLALSGEFTTAIAHSIREQTQLFTKSLYLIGHPFDGRPIEDSDLRDALLPSPLPQVFRPSFHAKEYTPYLYELSQGEIERAEKSESREQRRQRRTITRRGGPVLPDLKERQRTVRTLIVSSVLPGAAENFEQSRIISRPEASGPKKRTPGQKADDSDSSSSEDSDPDSPAMSQTPGANGRTRRGAASAAQVAMRNLGRSATPDLALANPHHHETRTSVRRVGIGRELSREDSAFDDDKMIVKLKIGRERFRRYMRERKAKAKEEEERAKKDQDQHFTGTGRPGLLSTSSQQGTPTPGTMGPPPGTPGVAPTSSLSSPTPQPSSAPQQPQGTLGGVDAPNPPLPAGYSVCV